VEAAFIDVAVVEKRILPCMVRPFYFAASNDGSSVQDVDSPSQSDPLG